MKELTIKDIETIVHREENRVMEAKETTGELVKGMQSGCAFLNTDGGWLFFGIHPTKLTILGQDVADRTRQEIAWEMRKFAPAIDLAAQYIPVPGREGKMVIAIYFPAPIYDRTPYTYDGKPYYKVENTTMPMPREMFDERIRLSNPKKFSWELTACEGATLRDIDNKTVDQAIANRKKVAQHYREALRNVPGIRFFDDMPGVRHNYSYFPVFINAEEYGMSRDDLYFKMKEANVLGRRYFYPLISTFSTYRGLPSAAPDNLPVATKIANEVICLPMHHELSEEDINRVLELIVR